MIITESEWAAAESGGLHIRVTTEPDLPKPPNYDDVPVIRIQPQSPGLPSLSSHPELQNRCISQPGAGHRRRLERRRCASASNLALDMDGKTEPMVARNGQAVLYNYLQKRHFVPFICVFTQLSFNSMILSGRDDATPYYHISVHLNCFIPSLHVTTICRGKTSEGEPVASFEMGIAAKKSTVTRDGREKLMDVVLSRSGSKSEPIWVWKWHSDPSLHLSWHCDSPVRYCYLSSQKHTSSATLLASYTPVAMSPRADGLPSPLPSLKLFPEGQRLFDDIVISALILERKRLTPQDTRILFN
ncbi:uncharacterized protein FIBRA_06959 [Fibroporia radiculosa]|uniref:DUF6593 domain-containing protein n=1 Tax=Fibroporia radiculosa TaxID=599839 RepID=J4GD03_9APHY|nr:uncharacterized protein FIBRA_06959 [Fibroporia radiculosa]CCM04768.1 predicted protein [Fibroporia radiculosa]